MNMRTTSKPGLLALGCIALAAATCAQAGGHISVVVDPFAIVGPPPPPVVYAPAPYYPAPDYPAPYYSPPPVVYVGGGTWGGDRRDHYRGGHDDRGGHRDHDGRR